MSTNKAELGQPCTLSSRTNLGQHLQVYFQPCFPLSDAIFSQSLALLCDDIYEKKYSRKPPYFFNVFMCEKSTNKHTFGARNDVLFNYTFFQPHFPSLVDELIHERFVENDIFVVGNCMG